MDQAQRMDYLEEREHRASLNCDLLAACGGCRGLWENVWRRSWGQRTGFCLLESWRNSKPENRPEEDLGCCRLRFVLSLDNSLLQLTEAIIQHDKLGLVSLDRFEARSEDGYTGVELQELLVRLLESLSDCGHACK